MCHTASSTGATRLARRDNITAKVCSLLQVCRLYLTLNPAHHLSRRHGPGSNYTLAFLITKCPDSRLLRLLAFIDKNDHDPWPW